MTLYIAPCTIDYICLHQGKELELYCETCEELIYHNCTIRKHYRPEHKFNLVGDSYHKAEIEASLEPVKMQMDSINKALEQLDLRSLELDNLQITLESSIQRQIQEFQELLEARKVDPELVSQLQHHIQTKKKNLAAQKKELETVLTQLASCSSFVRESLRIYESRERS